MDCATRYRRAVEFTHVCVLELLEGVSKDTTAMIEPKFGPGSVVLSKVRDINICTPLSVAFRVSTSFINF